LIQQRKTEKRNKNILDIFPKLKCLIIFEYQERKIDFFFFFFTFSYDLALSEYLRTLEVCEAEKIWRLIKIVSIIKQRI